MRKRIRLLNGRVYYDGCDISTWSISTWSSRDIEDYPDYVGKPFDLGRENTRLYVIRSDTKEATFTSDVKYRPQFFVI